MTRERFHELVAEAIRHIPCRFQGAMQNVAVVIEDRPALELLETMQITLPDTLYGLYQGTPLTARVWSHANSLPDQITIFREPIVMGSTDENAVTRSVGETIIHEFGHYFGLSEDEIEEVETRYWRGKTDD